MVQQPRAWGSYHWNKYKIETLLPENIQGKRILLFGCGDASEKSYLVDRGFEIISFDIRKSNETDFLADGHALPLKSASFDMVLSMQVFEHLHSPWIAVKEISRVLKPQGYFLGSVAFLKPYHHSYFHMSHLGIIHLLATANLIVDQLYGTQSLTSTFYSKLIPIGSQRISQIIYSTFDEILFKTRSKLWSWKTGFDANKPTERFGDEFKMSFNTFSSLRFAPTVVFRAQKNEMR